ncbi:helicase-related protein [Ruegeria aquimaris]|uniref:Helicase-related protein n=1 Tax=Ruegeria aquimaris TaxID=2984333 RepID=A0ABT3APQ1_9RHOB|nr:helicase-related protein [Ruegeria sp. XHP0148]MCV2890665.1 helicase-related protein [Ruegeria sp. XHP0148]
MMDRFCAEDALRSLKAFQRATVDYVSRRLLIDADATRHFLVADEVGLGKTLVARGVIARTIEALQDTIPRIDIVYICSNGAIARQNVARLNVMGNDDAHVLPTRLTMLAMELARAGGIRPTGVNFFSLTPGTSLDVKSGGGMKAERALILRLIRPLLEDQEAVTRMLQGYAGVDGWKATRNWVDAQPVEPQIAEKFRQAVAARPDLLRELEDCAQAYKEELGHNTNLNRRREKIVGELRALLARESAEALEPDLIVLDEFQRFTELLHGDGEAADLARKLFDAKDPDGNQAKVLLLSATPYRMLSLRDDEADAGDHYREFLDVIGFLFGTRGPQVRAELETEMRRFRHALQSLPASFDRACTVREGIETTLRQVIARTERVSETQDRDAMMRDIDVPVTIEAADLVAARAIARVAAEASAPGTVEYWKSAPYLLSFLRDYKLGQRLETLKDNPPDELLDAIRAAQSAQLDTVAIDAYQAIPENNGRLRALKQIAFENDMAQRLWVPPSLPYFGRPVNASKVLVFSQWSMVPDAIAALLSYESERAMEMGHTKRTYSARHPQLLNFRRNKDRLTGLRVLPLVIPSPTLARLVDPLEIFRKEGPLGDVQALRVSARHRLKDVAETLSARLRAVARGTNLPSLQGEDQLERAETWDWACAASLDMETTGYDQWLGTGRILTEIVRDDGQEAWHEHLQALDAAARDNVLHGTPEVDALLDHLVDLALGSPATCALRALHRVAPDLPLDHPAMLDAAARIGMAFRGLFNQPESQALLRGGETDEVYWQAVLHHCIANDLQSVLDEYVHVLLEAEGLNDATSEKIVTALAATMDEALSIKPAQIELKQYQARDDRIEITPALRMRGRFATRLLQGAQEDGAAQRTDSVRTAFNSPFRPFVLATTSVGQEGLDFHPYCHRLVHWNLPTNPVDLEQREGRVHRYKNHAVRLNLAAQQGDSLRSGSHSMDPWQQMFLQARAVAKRDGDMEPYWLLEGETCIERYTLSLPFSREEALSRWLKRSVALYRIAFGQPRQDDLLAFLQTLEADRTGLDLQKLQISLRPR